MKLTVTSLIGFVLFTGVLIVSRSDSAPGEARTGQAWTGTTDELLANLINEVGQLRQRMSQLERQVAALTFQMTRGQDEFDLDKHNNAGVNSILDTALGAQGNWPDVNTIPGSGESKDGADRKLRLQNISGYDVDEHGLLIDQTGRPVGLWGVDQGHIIPVEGALRR